MLYYRAFECVSIRNTNDFCTLPVKECARSATGGLLSDGLDSIESRLSRGVNEAGGADIDLCGQCDQRGPSPGIEWNPLIPAFV